MLCFPVSKTSRSLLCLQELARKNVEWIELLGLVIEGVGRGLPHGLLVASLKTLLTLACKPMDPVVPQSISLPQLLCSKE